MPPAPSGAMTSYGPRRVPLLSVIGLEKHTLTAPAQWAPAETCVPEPVARKRGNSRWGRDSLAFNQLDSAFGSVSPAVARWCVVPYLPDDNGVNAWRILTT